MSEVRQQINDILKDTLYIDEAELIDDASLSDDLGMDSLDSVEFVMEIEKKFNIYIPDENIEKVNTLGEVYTLVEKIISEKE